MPLSTQIPERVSHCRAYIDNTRLSVTGELTLPDFSRPTQDVSGAGIAGTVSTPTRGNLEAMQASFACRVITAEALAAFTYAAHSLEFRAIIQGSDATGAIEQRFSAFMRAIPVSVTSGTVNNGEEMGASVQFEVLDIRIDIDGVTLVNVSKLNNIVQFANAQGVLVDENATAQEFLA